ncbi:hypothetical protein [Nocardioides sp.]|uniref:hypothetical protein n=1 Tax=Nocardioides sp. TaxID=35761 RepID=UPI002ED5E100
MSALRSDNPPPLTVAASLAAVQGGLLVLYGVLEVANLSLGRVTMGVTTAVFFLAAGTGLGVCAFYVQRRSSWARSPIVLAQLIQLGLAWNFRSAPTTWLAVVLAVVALIVLVGIFHPASLNALEGSAAEADQP